eukprot:gnl/MRDRNA2_/MRDRNA2_118953_c0_seq1.p1 gnl/MRDRNA2_/MRDRNA2_118953_c0~~gnl/MRDRNA2_/MRDRNA2_118953_c0_seq1.p1  ORF type:complete len:360 (+),score=60.78 gnl/MRDRNA2_/MRDRNA2_118953_c0_seq1:105-1184(+)
MAGPDAERTVHSDFGIFAQAYPLKRAAIPRTDDTWAYYEGGPTDSPEALIFIHGTSGTAGVFFYQLDALATKGFRVISCQYAAYYSCQDWCKGLDLFLDIMKVQKVHCFGAALGGFLVQHYASLYPKRVKSLILCNSFCSTRIFSESAPFISMVHITPTAVLRKFVLNSFPEFFSELKVKQAADWVAQQVADMDGTDLASRLSLNCLASVVGPLQLDDSAITLIETNDKTMVPNESRIEQRNRYSGAKVAQLKSGGDFPFLSRYDEVTLFIEVHMRGMGVFPDKEGRGVAVEQKSAPAPPPWSPDAGKAPVVPTPKSGGYSGGMGVSAAKPAEFPSGSIIEEKKEEKKWVNPFEDDGLL